MLDKQVFPSHSSARGLIHSSTCAFIQQTLTGSLLGARYDANYKDDISSLQEADRKSQHNGESTMTEEIGVNREGWANRIGFWRWWEMAGVLMVELMSMCICERESERWREEKGWRERKRSETELDKSMWWVVSTSNHFMWVRDHVGGGTVEQAPAQRAPFAVLTTNIYQVLMTCQMLFEAFYLVSFNPSTTASYEVSTILPSPYYRWESVLVLVAQSHPDSLWPDGL